MVYVHELTRVYQKVASDARRLAASNTQLATEVGQARLDALTGLPSRGRFIELAGQLCAREHGRGHAMALLFIDLDGFKAINDARGHAVGDQVLVQTAQALRAVVRDGDAVGRLGGDEFVIAVTAAADQIDATATTARLSGGDAPSGLCIRLSSGWPLSKKTLSSRFKRWASRCGISNGPNVDEPSSTAAKPKTTPR